MSARPTRQELMEGFALTTLFVAKQLGPRPRRIVDQDAAITRASDALDSLTSDEAKMTRRILAIEYVARTSRHRGGPTKADWEVAIVRVDGAAADEISLMARGGMSLRASSGGWGPDGGVVTKKRRKAESVERLASRRTPGLDGTYDGTCVACLRPTDTALGFRGEPEWHAAGLTRLGLPIKEAITIVHRLLEEASGGPDPDGRYSAVYRVCGDCAARTPGFPKPVLALAGEPVTVIEQPPA